MESLVDKILRQLNDKFVVPCLVVLQVAWRLLLCTLSSSAHSSPGHAGGHAYRQKTERETVVLTDLLSTGVYLYPVGLPYLIFFNNHGKILKL